MVRYYTPGDPKSSPYEPMIGASVLYRPRKNTPGVPELAAAIITAMHKDDRCDLIVFTNTGNYHVTKVPYNESHESENCWFWPQPLQRRPIQKAENPVSCEEEKNQDSTNVASETAVT